MFHSKTFVCFFEQLPDSSRTALWILGLGIPRGFLTDQFCEAGELLLCKQFPRYLLRIDLH